MTAVNCPDGAKPSTRIGPGCFGHGHHRRAIRADGSTSATARRTARVWVTRGQAIRESSYSASPLHFGADAADVNEPSLAPCLASTQRVLSATAIRISTAARKAALHACTEIVHAVIDMIELASRMAHGSAGNTRPPSSVSVTVAPQMRTVAAWTVGLCTLFYW
jgi:hypothetical protein